MPLVELQQRAGVDEKELKLWLTRLSKWWGYLEIELPTVCFTNAGLKAQAVWQPLEQIDQSPLGTTLWQAPDSAVARIAGRIHKRV